MQTASEVVMGTKTPLSALSLAGLAPNSTLLQAHHTFFWQLVFFEWLAHGGDLPIPQEGVSRDHLLDGTEKITRHTTRRHALGKVSYR